MEATCVALGLVAAGIVMIVLGMRIRMGGFKRLYVIQMIPVIAPQAYKNAFIPLGISTVFLGLSVFEPILPPAVEMRRTILGYVVLPSFIISIVLAISGRPPGSSRAGWYTWKRPTAAALSTWTSCPQSGSIPTAGNGACAPWTISGCGRRAMSKSRACRPSSAGPIARNGGSDTRCPSRNNNQNVSSTRWVHNSSRVVFLVPAVYAGTR